MFSLLQRRSARWTGHTYGARRLDGSVHEANAHALLRSGHSLRLGNVRDESGASAARSWWDDRWQRGRQPRPRWCWTSSASAAAERTRSLFGRLVNRADISASGPVWSARSIGSRVTWCQARPDPSRCPRSVGSPLPEGSADRKAQRTRGLPPLRLFPTAFLRISMNFSSCSSVRSARMRTLDLT